MSNLRLSFSFLFEKETVSLKKLIFDRYKHSNNDCNSENWYKDAKKSLKERINKVAFQKVKREYKLSTRELGESLFCNDFNLRVNDIIMANACKCHRDDFIHDCTPNYEEILDDAKIMVLFEFLNNLKCLNDFFEETDIHGYFGLEMKKESINKKIKEMEDIDFYLNSVKKNKYVRLADIKFEKINREYKKENKSLKQKKGSIKENENNDRIFSHKILKLEKNMNRKTLAYTRNRRNFIVEHCKKLSLCLEQLKNIFIDKDIWLHKKNGKYSSIIKNRPITWEIVKRENNRMNHEKNKRKRENKRKKNITLLINRLKEMDYCFKEGEIEFIKLNYSSCATMYWHNIVYRHREKSDSEKKEDFFNKINTRIKNKNLILYYNTFFLSDLECLSKTYKYLGSDDFKSLDLLRQILMVKFYKADF